jgi:hypothetical protein
MITIALMLAMQDNTLTEEEKKDGWRLLFDGKTTEGWRGYRKKTCSWKVEDGALVCAGGGDVITVEQFEDFDLLIDWKIAKKGNSGIMFRVVETEGASYMSGPEFQILDNAGHGAPWDGNTSAGSCYALYAPTKDAAKPGGEWNRARILSKGGRVEHWLNGEKICEYEIGGDDWKKRVAGSKFKAWAQFGANAKGHLCVQDHGDRVEIKNVKVRIPR